MDILRITTAGSVDDGKSTLIGRLLFDTNSLPKDKLEAIAATSKRKGLEFTDLSLLTDGLIAEREQGITIDVAYIYFSTPQRKFIIADTPGHIEYTRNMITGASTSSVFMILIDARHGITEQTRRHFFIASLLRIRDIAVCINKMDLVGYKEEIFESIRNEFTSISIQLGVPGQDILFIPVVAKEGDNIVKPSTNMNWYSGPTLLEYLESIDPSPELNEKQTRFPVQYVIRPHSDLYHDYRGYAGRLASGTLSKGDHITILPSLKSSTIRDIFIADEKVQVAHSKDSIVITLENDIDISRGNMILKSSDQIIQVSSFKATICWMNDQGTASGKTYLVRHGVNVVKAKLTFIESKLDITKLEYVKATEIGVNDIARVEFKLAKPIFADSYNDNASNGSFILVDEFSNSTVAAGFII